MRTCRWPMFMFLFALCAAFLASCGGGDDDDSDDDDASDDAGDDAGDDVSDDASDDAGDDAADDAADDATDDDYSEFFPPPAGPLGTYRLYIDEEETEFSDIPAEVVGEDTTTFPGETYSLLQLGNFDEASTDGQKTWFDLSVELKAGIKRSEVYYQATGKETDPSFSITFEPAIMIDFSAPVGDEQTSSAVGTWDFGDTTVESDFDAAATVLDDNATIEVPFGEITGCLHVALTVTETGEDEVPFPVDSEFYLHPVYGMVRVEMIPGFVAMELVNPPE
jgi:hypothetical protein